MLNIHQRIEHIVVSIPMLIPDAYSFEKVHFASSISVQSALER